MHEQSGHECHRSEGDSSGKWAFVWYKWPQHLIDYQHAQKLAQEVR